MFYMWLSFNFDYVGLSHLYLHFLFFKQSALVLIQPTHFRSRFNLYMGLNQIHSLTEHSVVNHRFKKKIQLITISFAYKKVPFFEKKGI